MSQPVIELRNVDRSFKQGRIRIPVLQDVNLKIQPLQYLCLVGESGCGKTTTGKIVAGLLEPSAGTVFFEGQDITKLHGKDYQRYRRSVQIIHQDPYASLNPAHTVYSTLSFPLFRHKFVKNRAQARDRVTELLETVDLTPAADIIDKYPHELSGGQRQRVSIARALTTNPSVIVADESVSMVDVSIRIGLLRMLMDMRDEFGVTIILITHDLALAKYFAWEGRLAVMYLGRIVEVGQTQDIIADPNHPYTKILLSAIPEADPERTRNKRHIQLRSEDIPRLTELPSGCAFHPRCPWFVPDVCNVRVPELKPVPGADDDTEVACIPLTSGEKLELYGT